MTQQRRPLTNEVLRKRFVSQFELVTYCIDIAKDVILSGRAHRVQNDSLNVADLILKEIASGKDLIEESAEEPATEEVIDEVVSEETPAPTEGEETVESATV